MHIVEMRNKRGIDFIKKAKDIHGNKYSYELVEYINSHTNVKIICKDHGI